MVWSDTRLGEYGAPEHEDRRSRARQSIPGPELFLSPPSGPGGQQVTLQGFGYQPMMNVFIQLGDIDHRDGAHGRQRRLHAPCSTCPSRARAPRT